MTVDPEGYGRIGMTEPPGHRSYINAGADELGSSEVPEVMQTYRRSSNLIANSNKEGRHVVRPEWGRALWERGKHEGILGQRGGGLGNPTLRH